MSEASPVTVILNVGSGHGDAADCERDIRAGFEAVGRWHRVLAVQVIVPQTPEARE